MGERAGTGSRGAVAAAALAAALLSFAAFAQTTSATRISGDLSATPLDGGSFTATFSCLGAPTCVGIFNATERIPECSNSVNYSDVLTITGVDVSRAGAIHGNLMVNGVGVRAGPGGGAGGPCTFSRDPAMVKTLAYTGTWDGSNGALTMAATDDLGRPFQVNGKFTATVSTAPPVFEMKVTGSITPTISDIEAQIQYRPQDVGTTASVFVFALAPAGKVKIAAAKAQHFGLMTRESANDTPLACVLAQLNASGQLVGVSAATLQAYTSGVLSSQGQAVQVLDNVATPNIAGATFFVGYGADGQTMIDSGINRNAVSVPAENACNPQPPQTGWWWNPLEGGRGFSIEAQGNNLFFAAFHYDASGRATWQVSPGPVSLGGSYFSSNLYNVTGGQTLGGPYHAANAASLGPITLAFSDASHGTMIWPGGTVPIERQPFVPGSLSLPALANQPENGWWWNPAESGRGFFIEWQGARADLAGYMYDDAGNPVWYISVYETPNPMSFVGNWWTFANGQSMGGAYKAPTFTSDHFAPVTIQFSGPDTAVMTLPNGRTTSLTRQRF